MPLEELLARPGGTVARSREPRDADDCRVALTPFTNEPILELRRAPVRAQLRGALEAFDAEPVIQVPVWVGEDARTGGALVSTDPGDPERVVAESAVASEADVDHALELAARAATGGARPPRSAPRCSITRRRVAARAAAGDRRARGARDREAVARGRRRRVRGDRLPRVLRARGDRAREHPRAARPRRRADPAARRAQRAALVAARRRRGDLAVELPGRDPARDGLGRAGDRQRRGPQARRAGAGLRATWSCARCASRACRADALALLPGEGPVGAQLVGDPRVHTIAFTGSGPVGLEIVRRAAELAPGQQHLKRVVAEMGGKNCVIVDSDADLDDVVPRWSSPRSTTRARSARRPRACSRTRRSTTGWSSGWRARSRCCTSARPPTPRSTSRR